MDRERGGSGSNTALFLMELIVVIGFFSLVAVICVRLFVAASVASSDSVDVNHATRTVTSMIETWTACEGRLDDVSALYPCSELTTESDNGVDGILTLWYDENWNAVSSGDESAYYVILSGKQAKAREIFGEEASGGAVTATVTARKTDDDGIVVTLAADHYVGGSFKE